MKIFFSAVMILGLGAVLGAAAEFKLPGITAKSFEGGELSGTAVPVPAAISKAEVDAQLRAKSPIVNFRVAEWAENTGNEIPEGLVFTGASLLKAADYEYLAKAGVKTVIGLQGLHTDDQALCKTYGLHCAQQDIFAFPKDFSDNDNFRAAFRLLVNETSAGNKVYIHCLGGYHRTGALALALKIRNAACGRQFDKAALRNETEGFITGIYGYSGIYQIMLFNWHNDILKMVDEFEKNQWLCE